MNDVSNVIGNVLLPVHIHAGASSSYNGVLDLNESPNSHKDLLDPVDKIKMNFFADFPRCLT